LFSLSRYFVWVLFFFFLAQIGHRDEVWSFDISSDQRYLVSGSTDPELRVWALRIPETSMGDQSEIRNKARKLTEDDSPSSAPHPAFDSAAATDAAAFHGILKRACTTHRVQQIRFNANSTMLAVASSDKMLEMFAVRSTDEVKRKVTRRLKRARERREKREKRKAEQSQEAESDDEEENESSTNPTPNVCLELLKMFDCLQSFDNSFVVFRMSSAPCCHCV
jgi:U3 small nucleolar RNA-associated protein 12